MPAPGYTSTVGDRGAASPAPDDVAALFAVGLTEKGRIDLATDVRSLSAFETEFGAAINSSQLHASVGAYFRRGGTRAVVSRVASSGAVSASLALSSAVPAVVMTVTAPGPGAYANGADGGYSITVLTGVDPARTVTVAFDGVSILSGVYSTADTLVDDLEALGLLVTLGAGSWPLAAIASTAFTGGDDDLAGVADADWQAALDVLVRGLGAGFITAPGITTPAVHAMLFAHAKASNRFALADGIDTPTAASLTAPASTLRAGLAFGYGQLLAGWDEVPGPGSTIVTIPPSAPLAGRYAKADRDYKPGPGQPAAATFGLDPISVGVSQTYTQADLDTLHEAGVTVIRETPQGVTAMGARTLANPDTYPQYVEASGMRVLMAVRSEAEAVLARYVQRTIDGRGHVLSELEKDLVGIGQKWYGRDALYGESAGDAFSVDVGPGVNPPASLAARELSAQMLIRTSPFAEQVSLLITKVASGDTV